MAERRMLSVEIVNRDTYTEMPTDAKFLYVMLVVNADDDGFVKNPRGICDMNHLSMDCLKLLIIKRFIIPFNCGCIVIRHWKQQNRIAKSKHKPTLYQEQLRMLTDVNGEYFLIGSEKLPELSSSPPEDKPEEDFIGEIFNNSGNFGCTVEGRLVKESKVQDSTIQDSGGKDRKSDPTTTTNESGLIPTLEEVTAYCEQRRADGFPNYIDPARFIIYNENRNWKNKDGTPIHWKTLIRIWELKGSERDRLEWQKREKQKAEEAEMEEYLSLVNRFEEDDLPDPEGVQHDGQI